MTEMTGGCMCGKIRYAAAGHDLCHKTSPVTPAQTLNGSQSAND